MFQRALTGLADYFYNDTSLTLTHSIMSLADYAYSRSPVCAGGNLRTPKYQDVKELFSVCSRSPTQEHTGWRLPAGGLV